MSLHRKSRYTVGFYNVENLFDTIDNPYTHDDEYTPNNKRRWTLKKYYNKVKKLSSVIGQIGRSHSYYAPAIVGLAEVENSKVIEDLIRHKNLLKHDYAYVHYDSSDERGIDVGLMYNRKCFEVLASKTYPLHFVESDGSVDYTRDILKVSGRLNGELIHIIGNHWPSRREGDQTVVLRKNAAFLVNDIIDEIKKELKDPKIIIMGDFNDNPIDDSVSTHLNTEGFFNPMLDLFNKGLGSTAHNKQWNLFDQIIFSNNFLEPYTETHSFIKADIFNKDWLRVYKGKLKGSPYRTYIGPWYKSGFSDHFPVFAILKRNT